jgi:hypothetical protein
MISTMIEDHIEDAASRGCPPALESSERLVSEAALIEPRSARLAAAAQTSGR